MLMAQRLLDGQVGTARQTVKSKIIREPLTEALVQAHIDGKQGVGAIPINEENQCRFGAIDVDVYDLNQKELQDKIQKLSFRCCTVDLSLVGRISICFSRSGSKRRWSENT